MGQAFGRRSPSDPEDGLAIAAPELWKQEQPDPFRLHQVNDKKAFVTTTFVHDVIDVRMSL